MTDPAAAVSIAVPAELVFSWGLGSRRLWMVSQVYKGFTGRYGAQFQTNQESNRS